MKIEEVRIEWEEGMTVKAEIPTTNGGLYVFLESQRGLNKRYYSLYHYFSVRTGDRCDWHCSAVVQEKTLLECVEKLGTLMGEKKA